MLRTRLNPTRAYGFNYSTHRQAAARANRCTLASGDEDTACRGTANTTGEPHVGRRCYPLVGAQDVSETGDIRARQGRGRLWSSARSVIVQVPASCSLFSTNCRYVCPGGWNPDMLYQSYMHTWHENIMLTANLLPDSVRSLRSASTFFFHPGCDTVEPDQSPCAKAVHYDIHCCGASYADTCMSAHTCVLARSGGATPFQLLLRTPAA
jgi:hypothetical protein